MTQFRVLIANLFKRERRQQDIPVAEDRRQDQRRRKRPGISEARERLLRSMDDFERTVVKAQKNQNNSELAVNDMQQVVLFPTLQRVCRFRGPDALKVRLCRHERHQDAANNSSAICEESKCPIILEAIAGGVSS